MHDPNCDTDCDTDCYREDLLDLGLTHEQVHAVMRWHQAAASRQAVTAGGEAIMRLMAYLLDGHRDGNLALRVAGIVYGLGLRSLTQHATLDDQAEALGVSRHALQCAAKQARKAILGE